MKDALKTLGLAILAAAVAAATEALIKEAAKRQLEEKKQFEQPS